MENKLSGKSDTEIIKMQKTLNTFIIMATIIMLILLVVVVYSIFMKDKPFPAVMLGGIVLPYIFLGTLYSQYDKEKKRRNL